MKRFAALTLVAFSALLLTAETYPRRWNQGGGSSYVSTAAGSILIGDGAGGYAEETGVVVDVTGFVTLASYMTATGVPFASGAANTASYGGTGIRIEGADDGNEGLITFVSPSSDWTITTQADGRFDVPALSTLNEATVNGIYLYLPSGQMYTEGAHDANPNAANRAAYGRDGAAWEGTTNDANQWNLHVEDAAGPYELRLESDGVITMPATISVGDDITMAGAGPKISSANNVNMTLEVPGVANLYVSAYGMEFQGTNFKINGYQMNMPQALTIADNGNGGTAATDSSTPTDSTVQVTCNDANGCEWTLGEAGMEQMPALTVVNVSANSLVMKDSAGVAELVGSADQTLGQYDAIELRWAVDRWIQTAPIANN